jgi:hypothetical protein
MRMKGKISTESSVQQFIRVMHTISKINKEAVLRWAQSKLYCILTAKDIADGSVKVWGEINLVCGHRFHGYKYVQTRFHNKEWAA